VIASPQRPPIRAPNFGDALKSWIDGWNVAVSGWNDYFAAALGGPAALDAPRRLQTAWARRPPQWSTPNEIVFEAPIARLRDFSVPGARPGVVPTLVLPPQAGHDSCIVDYSSEQSQMQTIVAAGLERALTLDWIGATPATADATIDDYVGVIDDAVDHCGGRVNLIGDCQGGWLATIYAALVAAAGGVLKGEHMLTGFIMIQPGNEISRQFDLLWHLHDPKYLARYGEFEDWFKHTQDIPGAFYLWIVRHLFRDNALIGGGLRVRGQSVDLARLTMPLNLLAGAGDHITPPDQVFALAQFASSPPDQVSQRTSTGGHLGLFMGHEALHDHWPPLLANVLAHSTTKAHPRG
jgi:poly(3-hydroxybutyrate) depolymerase